MSFMVTVSIIIHELIIRLTRVIMSMIMMRMMVGLIVVLEARRVRATERPGSTHQIGGLLTLRALSVDSLNIGKGLLLSQTKVLLVCGLGPLVSEQVE
jgi:hypothetical protein